MLDVAGREMTWEQEEAWRDHDNTLRLDAGATRYRAEPTKWDAVRFECFNREEARKAKEYATRKHPDVPWLFSWLHGADEPLP